jgi:hypothetical protein
MQNMFVLVENLDTFNSGQSKTIEHVYKMYCSIKHYCFLLKNLCSRKMTETKNWKIIFVNINWPTFYVQTIFQVSCLRHTVMTNHLVKLWKNTDQKRCQSLVEHDLTNGFEARAVSVRTLCKPGIPGYIQQSEDI